MDGQNFNNGFDNNQNTDATPVTEPTPETATTSASETAGEIVNVNTGNYQDNSSSFVYSYQNDNNSGSYNYQGDTAGNSNFSYQSNTTNSGNFNNYQDNTSQYYTSPAYTDNSNQQGESTPGFAIASLVLGIISILSCCCWGGGIVFAVPGIIMGISANKKVKTGVGTSGIVCSIVGAVFNAIMLIYFVAIIALSVAAEM